MSQAEYPSRPRQRISERLVKVPSDGGALPLVCRWPDGVSPMGYVVFCHGLGASGSDYAELSRYWAEYGYLVIHPTFPDSAEAVARAEPQLGFEAGGRTSWLDHPGARARLYEILHTPSYWLARIRIVRQTMEVIDAVFGATCGGRRGSTPGAIAGHSFGAYTSQLLAGAEIDLPGEGPRSFKDGRFAAAILLSAQGRDQQGLREGSWDGIDGPMLNVTGTLDGGAKGQDWHWKVEPYELAPAGDKYLALLTDADHYLGGIARRDQFPVPAQRDAVEQITLAFLDAYLRKDLAARAWLGGITDRVGDCPGVFEHK